MFVKKCVLAFFGDTLINEEKWSKKITPNETLLQFEPRQLYKFDECVLESVFL